MFQSYQKGKFDLQTSEFRRIKNELTFVRQYKAFLINLAQEIESSEASFETNGIKYDK